MAVNYKKTNIMKAKPDFQKHFVKFKKLRNCC
jgi:hypothetical protein